MSTAAERVEQYLETRATKYPSLDQAEIHGLGVLDEQPDGTYQHVLATADLRELVELAKLGASIRDGLDDGTIPTFFCASWITRSMDDSLHVDEPRLKSIRAVRVDELGLA